MPVRPRKDLTQSLKQGKIESVYFLFGPETQLRDEAARAIADEALRDTLLREFNEASFSLANGDPSSAIAAAEQLPMMSSRRVVRITNFTKLDEAGEAILQQYLDRPVESTVMLFIADDIDKRKKLAKTLMSRAAFEFAPLSNAELESWARGHLKSLQADADANVLQTIVELVGQDVRRLSNELNKLSAAALPSGKITKELVEALVSRSRELMNYDLTDQMILRNRLRALKTLKHLLDDGAQPVMLIGLLGSTYRRMALAQTLLSQGVSSREIFRQVPMPPFKQQSFLATLSRTDSKTLALNIARIAAADLGIKTSKATPRMQVEMLVCELTAS
ncbi:MAG TPA: DNA polymerase III subunit delta [Pyrinomonadaceae bacterium]|nr:DNA polymerase III subunit delta [Pyrinomonadaceae bacterium]